jgi:hypothetical protein
LNRELLYQILAAAADCERDERELESEVQGFAQFATGTADPHTLIQQLVRARGLEQFEYGEDGGRLEAVNAEAALSSGGRLEAVNAEATLSSGGRLEASPTNAAAPSSDGQPEACPTESKPTDAPPGLNPCPSTAVTAATAATAATAQQPLVARRGYLTTSLGRRYLAEHSPDARIAELLATEAELKPTLRCILQSLSQGRQSLKDISTTLISEQATITSGNDSIPLQPSVFIDMLEKAGAIAWQGGWEITDAGRRMLENLSPRKAIR